MRAVIATGSGRYDDPWHPFLRTSRLLGETLAASGFECAIDEDVDGVMTRLRGVDLLVVNAGDPWRDDREPSAPDASIDGLAEALRAGIGVLAVHRAVSSLRDYPEWASATGALWIPDASHHPPIGETVIRRTAFPDAANGDDFAVMDERYCRLQRTGRHTVVATHEGEHGPEPTAWVREVGRSRVAVDLLGHDERSYDSPGHRALIRDLALWAVDDEHRGARGAGIPR